MLIGKLNYEKISKDYTGLETETAKTIVDNEKQTIKVDVKAIDELTSLKDVSISNLQNDQILQYNEDHNIWINKDLEEESPESIKEKYESNANTNAFTDLDKNKVDIININGDGNSYLSDDGTYKILDLDIDDSLTSVATDKALSANQGRVLNEKVESIKLKFIAEEGF